MRFFHHLIVIGIVWLANTSFVLAQQGELVHGSQIDDREVYVVTSKVNGKLPKIGPVRHASIAICPRGVSPIRYENGVAVSNWEQCTLYGTQIGKRGFEMDQKRIGARAIRVHNVSASTVEQRLQSHFDLNIPLLNDCRHHVIQVLEIRNRRGRYMPARKLK